MANLSTALEPAPFTSADFASRLQRASDAAKDAGLVGVLVTPGPDLMYLTGYAPVAITERITMLVVPADGEPALIVPKLERPDAEEAPSAQLLRITDWTDGSDPYEAAARLLAAEGRYAVSDSAWSMHLLGLQDRLPASSYVSMTAALPMLRAVKDNDELDRLAAAAAAADRTYEAILEVRFAGRSETEVGSDLADLLRLHGHSQVDFTVVGSGPNGANPHHEIGPRIIQEGDMVVLDFGGLKHGYGSDTTRTVHVGDPSTEEREVHDIVRRAQQAGFGGHQRSRIWRLLHPPHRTRNRADNPRTAVHGRRRDTPTSARHVLLHRTRHLPAEPVRRPDRRHRGRDR
jgi:Xaa-Pro aminopeptidase